MDTKKIRINIFAPVMLGSFLYCITITMGIIPTSTFFNIESLLWMLLTIVSAIGIFLLTGINELKDTIENIKKK